MNCPVCSSPLHELDLDLQHVFHCVICGTSIFEDGGINRVTSTTAKYLKENSTGVQDPEKEPAVKLCPFDQTPLVVRVNQEAIPTHVHLLHCPKCQRIVAKPQDLLDFKHAQEAKVNYIKAWRLPMPQLRTVFAIVTLAVMSVFGYLSFSSLGKSASMKTEASQAVQNLQVEVTGRLVVVSFRTDSAVRTALVIVEPPGVPKIPVSGRPNTIHTTSFSRPTGAKVLRLRVELTDESGHSVLSDDKVVELKR